MKKPINVGILLITLLVAALLTSGCSEPVTKTTPTSSATPPSIAIATDKTQYVSGETVKLTVTNNLDVPIWYIGYPQPDLAFWDIETAKSNGWQPLDFRLPRIEGSREVCRIIMYERPIGAVMELKPHSDLFYDWNKKICSYKTVTEPFEPEMIERGRYRFALHYSLDTVKSEDIETEPWKRPIELGETKMVYSNEFVLE
jgi:uncharacterized protein YceK